MLVPIFVPPTNSKPRDRIAQELQKPSGRWDDATLSYPVKAISHVWQSILATLWLGPVFGRGPVMTNVEGLKFGRIGDRALHLVIDLQVMFSEATKWASPAVSCILPAVEECVAWAPEHTVFTRFLTPADIGDAKGQWRRFYADTPSMLAARLPPEAFEIVPPLRAYVPPAAVVDRYVYSVFASSRLREILADRRPDTLIISGVEVDVCVLASLIDAIDFGYRVIVLKDGVAGSRADGEAAVLKGLLPRFEQQVELVETEVLLRNWRTVEVSAT